MLARKYWRNTTGHRRTLRTRLHCNRQKIRDLSASFLGVEQGADFAETTEQRKRQSLAENVSSDAQLETRERRSTFAGGNVRSAMDHGFERSTPVLVRV